MNTALKAPAHAQHPAIRSSAAPRGVSAGAELRGVSLLVDGSSHGVREAQGRAAAQGVQLLHGTRGPRWVDWDYPGLLSHAWNF